MLQSKGNNWTVVLSNLNKCCCQACLSLLYLKALAELYFFLFWKSIIVKLALRMLLFKSMIVIQASQSVTKFLITQLSDQNVHSFVCN